jgi:CheY-like chemotaxis protein
MKRVLYVDDETDRESFQSTLDTLRGRGIDVKAIGNVREVLPFLEAEGRTLVAVVLDVFMPTHGMYTPAESDRGMRTGLLLLRDIRQRYANLPIILVSVLAEETAEEWIRVHNVAAYFTRPVLAGDIARAIHALPPRKGGSE